MKLKMIDAGEIVSTHGVKGELKVLPWLDSPEMLCQFHRCQLEGTEYVVESCRVQNTCNLLKLRGVETMEAAQAMRGKTVRLYREDIDDNVIFAAELLDVDVLCDGKKIGIITDVLDYPGNSVYVVGNETSKNAYMIPAVKEFILSTDLSKNEMCVRLIEGMATDES